MEIELNSGFENAIMVNDEPDRVYDAEDVNERFEGLVSSYGVYSNIGSACQVVAGTDLKVVVKTGKGEVNNHYFKIESDTELTLETADVILNRIDSIVIRRNKSNRNIVLAVKKGTLATTPVAPTITRTDSIQEICLANVYIGKGATSIKTSNITDTRSNNSLCGFIACLVEQLDTTTLFNQYAAAQNDFINNQTTQFENWFDNIQDEVKATNLYREYQAVYRSNIVNQTVITIPTSINYVHNGLDVLNVFINGMRLLKDVEYTINSAGTQITLTTPLDVASQDIEFVNKKSVEGTIAESTVLRVETLEGKVADIQKYSYEANGTNDDVVLSNIVKNFLNGVGDYSSVSDNSNLTIVVNGVLGFNYSSDTALFDFQNTTNSNRKICIDFGNATIPYSQNITKSIYAIFYENDNVTIKNANIKIDNIKSTTLYIFHGGIIKNCNVYGTNSATTLYGAWGCQEISGTKINVSGLKTAYGVYGGRNSLYNVISMNATTNYSIKGCHRCIGNDYNGKLEGYRIGLGNSEI